MSFALSQSSTHQTVCDDYDRDEDETMETNGSHTSDSGYDSQSQQTEPSQSQTALTDMETRLPSQSEEEGASSHRQHEIDRESSVQSESTTVKAQPILSDSGTKAEVLEPTIPSLVPEDMSIQELHSEVKALFPGFKPNGILRFSSLLGVGKPSSLPRLWQEAKKPKRRKKEERSSPKEWKFDFDMDHVPPPELCLDDEVNGIAIAVKIVTSTDLCVVL